MNDVYTNLLNNILNQLRLKARVVAVNLDDPFIIFDLKLLPGSKFKQIEKHATEIALGMKAISDPLIYPVTTEGVVRVEIMTSNQDTVNWHDIIISNEFLKTNCILPLALGKLRNGKNLIVDLQKMPHLLVGGVTGSGKSIILHSIINSILESKRNVEFALIDVKKVEFSYYSSINCLYSEIANDSVGAANVLDELINEMESRFLEFKKHGCRNIETYHKDMPYIVVVIDEFADLMMAGKKAIQERVCRLAQKSRACGIHLVVATQRPSADVVTGLIKANFPARISCKVSASINSRIMLDRNGAEKLLGNGDAIIDCGDFSFNRFKAGYLSEAEIVKSCSKHRRTLWNKIWNG